QRRSGFCGRPAIPTSPFSRRSVGGERPWGLVVGWITLSGGRTGGGGRGWRRGSTRSLPSIGGFAVVAGLPRIRVENVVCPQPLLLALNRPNARFCGSVAAC